MPYPKEYVGHYHHLANWLKLQGHSIYPMEMICNPVHHARNCFVDVVSMRNEKIWAWEYKSRRDNIKRAIPQVENYRESFDYVSVVAEKVTDFMKVHEKLKSLGIGMLYQYEDNYRILEEPKLQMPHEKLQVDLVNRFHKNVFHKPLDPFQKKLLEK